jgi:DNA replication protein DnaC
MSKHIYLAAGLVLPPRCELFTLESSPLVSQEPHRKTLDFLAQWDGHKNLAYFGETGTGKTGLAVGVLKLLMHRAAAEGWQMTFTSVTTFFGQLQHGFEDKTYQQTLDRACKVRLLCLDDIGAEQPSDWKRSLFYELLNRRYEAQLPTIITTNWNLKQLEDHLTKRVFDRLMEHCTKIAVNGKNLRIGGA